MSSCTEATILIYVLFANLIRQHRKTIIILASDALFLSGINKNIAGKNCFKYLVLFYYIPFTTYILYKRISDVFVKQALIVSGSKEKYIKVNYEME